MLNLYLESIQSDNVVFVTEGKILDAIKNLNLKKLGEVFKNLDDPYVKPLSFMKAKFSSIPKMSPSTANKLIEGKVKNYKVYKNESEKLVKNSDLSPQVKEGLAVIGGISGALKPDQFKKMKMKVEDEDLISGWDLIATFMQAFGTAFIAIMTIKALTMTSIGGTVTLTLTPPFLIAVGCLVCAYIIQMIRE